MPMTPDSFTGNDSYDKLVTSYLVLRIFLSASIMILCGTQTILEIRALKRRNRPIITPRILTFISLTMFPVFRVLYSAILFKTHNFDYGSTVVYLGMWTTFFIFNIWIWICCVWMQLLYTFFISKRIRLRNTQKVFYYSWFVSFLSLLYTVAYTVISAVDKKAASTFYAAGFMGIIGVFGAVLIVNGVILSKEIRKHEKKMNNDRISNSVSKIRKLAGTLAFTVIAALLRDLAFLFVKASMYDNIRHFSAFYTFFLETTQGIIVMVALAERPGNYLKFQRVYVSSRAFNVSSGSQGTGKDQNSSGKSSYDSSVSKKASYSIEMNSLDNSTAQLVNIDGIIVSKGPEIERKNPTIELPPPPQEITISEDDSDDSDQEDSDFDHIEPQLKTQNDQQQQQQ